MSGLFGVIGSAPEPAVGPLVDAMSRSLAHRAWHECVRLRDPRGRFDIGRIGIGIFNRGTEPFWNSDATQAVMLVGEIYKIDDQPVTAPQAQQGPLVLDLYNQRGSNFAARLNGVFLAAIVDLAKQRVLLANDRFGLYPLYYCDTGGHLAFAPELKGVLCDPGIERRLDLVALTQYMRFQHLLGQRTFFEDIRLLQPASVLEYDLGLGAWQSRQYWDYGQIPFRPDVPFGEAVEEAGRLLRRAILRMSGDQYRPGVYLSGGLDSRTILGLTERRPIASLTYGARGCRDVHYAGLTAKAAGSSHHWIDLPNGSWVKECVDDHLNLTEGFHSWIHAHGMSTLDRARELMDVNLTGWDGGTIMGHADLIEPLQIDAVDDVALTARMFRLFNQTFTWPSIDEATEQTLYGERMSGQTCGLAFDSFKEEFRHYLGFRPDVRTAYFYVSNHCLRLTFNMITFGRSHIEYRFPFFDYDLFDFLYSLPARVRGHRMLFRALIQREIPRLAYIPYDNDEFLPTTRRLIRTPHAFIIRAKRRVNRHIAPIFESRATLYADYEEYLRTELRSWAESILFDRTTTERGVFNMDTVRSLFARHQSGREPWTIGFIAPIMTYEMMLRLLLDRPWPAA